MKAVVKWLLENIVVPILLIVLAPAITTIVSKVSTDDWFKFFSTTPVVVWAILAIILVPWTMYAIHHRTKHIQEENWSSKPLRFKPSGGWKSIDTVKYADVIWNVRVPVQASTFRRSEVVTRDALDIEIPPRCPKCGTELEQTKNFWGRYVWKCVNCGFHKRNRDDFSREERRVIKLARKQFDDIYQSKPENRQ